MHYKKVIIKPSPSQPTKTKQQIKKLKKQQKQKPIYPKNWVILK